MRALLVNPWIHDFAAYDLWARPLGLLYIAAYLKACGIQVDLIDCLDRKHPRLTAFLKKKIPHNAAYGCGNYYSQEIEKPEIFRAIARRYKRYGLPKELFVALLRECPPPDIILVTSGMTYWYPGVFETIRMVKERFNSVPIVLGGIYARLCAAHAEKYSGADAVYSGRDVTEIASLVLRLTGYRLDRFTVNIEELFYAYELYPSLEAVTLRTSSGCPFTCSYCGLRLLEKDFIQRDPGFIVNNVEYLYRVRGVRNFAFYDDALLFHAQNHALQFMAGFVARNIRANFHTPNGLNVRYIDQDVATALKASGFCHPRLGLEVVSGTRQSQTGAKVTNNEFEKAVGYLRQAGYAPRDIGVNILMGLPGQDIREIEESVRFVSGHGAVVHWEEYSPVPGTPDFLFSGLTLLSDPLLHNNSAFPLYRPDDHRRFQEIKDLVHRLNGRLNKEGG